MEPLAAPPGEPGPAAARSSAGDGLLTRLEDVATLALHGVPGCDAAAVSVLLDTGMVTMVATSAAASDLEAVQLQWGRGPGLSALRRGQVVLVDDYRIDPRWPDVGRAAVAHGLRSTLALPLADADLLLGSLNLHGARPAAFGGWAGHVAGVLARQAAAAISDVERGRRTGARLSDERRVAQALQRELVPVLPLVPGLVTAGRYVAADAGTEVGGDWYDVFPLPHGAIGVAVGDVMGHGLAAAQVMSQVRTGLRAYAYEARSPADVLDRLDRLVQAFDLALTTAVYARMVLRDGGAQLLLCNAGHPPPVVRWPDGRVSQLDVGSSWLLGGPTEQLGPRTDAAVRLPSGSVLVLYTDGLVERRGRHLDHGVGLLRASLAGVPTEHGPELLVDRLLDAVCADGCTDDLALLVVQVR